MAEEHQCQTPEGHHLCANNCGFLGSTATMNLCSNCYGDLCLKQQQQQQQMSASPPSSEIASVSSPVSLLKVPEKKSPVPVTPLPKLTAGEQNRPNRCNTCKKRVGLTGFKCRCGTTFCGTHRYPEIHGCTFDFKSVGREEIAKANPLVKAAKLQKI